MSLIGLDLQARFVRPGLFGLPTRQRRVPSANVPPHSKGYSFCEGMFDPVPNEKSKDAMLTTAQTALSMAPTFWLVCKSSCVPEMGVKVYLLSLQVIGSLQSQDSAPKRAPRDVGFDLAEGTRLGQPFFSSSWSPSSPLILLLLGYIPCAASSSKHSLKQSPMIPHTPTKKAPTPYHTQRPCLCSLMLILLFACVLQTDIQMTVHLDGRQLAADSLSRVTRKDKPVVMIVVVGITAWFALHAEVRLTYIARIS